MLHSTKSDGAQKYASASQALLELVCLCKTMRLWVCLCSACSMCVRVEHAVGAHLLGLENQRCPGSMLGCNAACSDLILLDMS